MFLLVHFVLAVILLTEREIDSFKTTCFKLLTIELNNFCYKAIILSKNSFAYLSLRCSFWPSQQVTEKALNLPWTNQTSIKQVAVI